MEHTEVKKDPQPGDTFVMDKKPEVFEIINVRPGAEGKIYYHSKETGQEYNMHTPDFKTFMESGKIDLKPSKEFSLDQVPFEDFEKLGISREGLENTPNLEALLSGKKTQTYPIHNFSNLEIEVKLKLEKNEAGKVQLVVYPEKMERKLQLETMVERLTRIKGVEDTTEYIQRKGFDRGDKYDGKLQNRESIEKYENNIKEYSRNSKTDLSDTKPDTWLKLDKKIAEHYIKNANMPVLKDRSNYYLGVKIKNIDNHSFKQHESLLNQVSKDLNKEKIRTLGVSR